jgi:hypothetical protein
MMPWEKYSGTVRDSDELQRVYALPSRIEPPTGYEQLSELFRLPGSKAEFRPIQGQALAEIHVVGGLIGLMRVGSGKTLVTRFASEMLDVHNPLLMVPAKLLGKTQREFAELNKEWRTPRVQTTLMSYERLGRARWANYLEELLPDMIICDECFVEGTQVDTPQGPIRIENITPGCQVYNASGIGVVEAVHQREVETITEIKTEFGVLGCTANHPFMTDSGWVAAGDLDVTHRLMKQCAAKVLTNVDEGVRGVWPDLPLPEEQATFLREQLCSEMEMPSTRLVGESKKSRQEDLRKSQSSLCSRYPEISSLPKEYLRTNEEQQPDDKSQGSGEDGRNFEKVGTCPEGSRRQWTRSHQSRKVAFRDFPPRLLEPVHTNRTKAGIRVSYGLQSGSSFCSREVGDRSRRGQSWDDFSATAGPEEGHFSYFSRVEGVKVQKQGDFTKYRKRRVYNLQVSGHPSYSVKGFLVHNCHRLKNPRAAVTRRVHRYIKEHPDTHFVALSGTLTRRTLMDFAHLAEWALGDGAPIPLQWPDLQEWCAALDEDSLVQGRFAPGALEVFLYPDEFGLTALRRGVQRRITSTPGVVATEESPIDASLLIDDWWPSYQPPESVAEATKRLHDDWETPDDVLLTSAADVWRHARELALGFYYKWDPRPPDWWLEPRREWSAFVRATLLRSRTLDSEQQVAELHREASIYLKWAEVREHFKPNVVPVWLDTAVMSCVAGWVEQPGIVWVEHQAVADKLVEFGVPYYGRMGLNRFGQPIEDAEGGIAASIEANKEGRNLQKYNRNLILSPPTTGQAWEQLLGRTHRDGQTADEVLVEVFFGCTENIKAFFQAMNDARYQRDITGTPQKLLEATVAFTDFTHKSKAQG